MKFSVLSLLAGACVLLVGCRSAQIYQYTVTSSATSVAADRQRAQKALVAVASQMKLQKLDPQTFPVILVAHLGSAPTRLVYYRQAGNERAHFELNANTGGNEMLIDLARMPRKAELSGFEPTHQALTLALGRAFGNRAKERNFDLFW